METTDWRSFYNRCGAPRRVAWAVAEHDGRRSICPLGWKMFASFNPPMMAIGIAPRRFTHELIQRSGEFVLAWPGEDLAEQTILCGTRSGRDLDKWEATGLTAAKADLVSAPLIPECIANLECRVTGSLPTGDHTIIAGEVLKTWMSDDDRRLQCITDNAGGYDTLLERPPWTIGVVRR